MLIRIVKFRISQGAAKVVWSTGNVYSTLDGKCFEMAICNTEEFGAYYDEDKCRMSDRWPSKRWKLAHYLMYSYIPEVHVINYLM